MQRPTAVEIELGRRASYVSLGVGVSLLALKFWAFNVTGSEAIFADAMESIVNVVAAGLAIVVIAIAAKPADLDHPYGHGKVEHFSAAFEGGLIAFASVAIWVEAAQALMRSEPLLQSGFGLLVTLGAGAANCLLGWYLVYVGRKAQSIALVASGRHVLSDFFTSLAVAFGLILTRLTGWHWIDPATAIALGAFLGWTGLRIVRGSIGGLLDEKDQESLRAFAGLVARDRPEGIIQIHHVRSIRSGRFHHIDAHVVVPEYWDVAEAHARTEAFEKLLMAGYPSDGELHLHVDPCRRAYCRNCDARECLIRQAPFERKLALSVDELTNPDEPAI
jgi:cation diffusion facilitator family transporter